jgi:signal transduction histidine kinase
VAILLLVAFTLLLATAGSILLVRRAAKNTAEQQLYSQAQAIADYPHPLRVLRELTAVEFVGQYASLTVIGLSAAGAFATGLPASLHQVDLDSAALLKGDAVGGSTGNLVYVLIPLQLTTAQKAAIEPAIPYEDQAVLVATRTYLPPVNGLPYFLLVALASLAVASAVAFALARRFSRPLTTAVSVTGRIAGGELHARIPVSRRDVPELGELATAINAMAESLERARSQQRQFLLSVSHDLRTPLTSIRGYADAVAEGATDDVAGAVAVIASEARRLERLVQDLLDLAQLDARRFSFRSSLVDAGDVVHQAVEGFTPTATAAGIELTADVAAPGTLLVLVDPDRLRQVLSNLVENAFKFARHRVVVGGRLDGRAVVLWVLDDGSGITPADLSRVFEPHFRSDRARKPQAGTGLGLAIVAELATAMGGGVRAESPVEAAGGTRLVLWFPVAETDYTRGTARTSAINAPGPGSASPAG